MSLSAQIVTRALELGFSSCGVVAVSEVEDLTKTRYVERKESGVFGNMNYLSERVELRFDPRLLLANARSLICVTLNYYPSVVQSEQLPQIAYCAYGRDYHKVVKGKLRKLLEYVQTLLPSVSGRCLVDSAPLIEKYWASRAGLGFIGKNGLLIDPRRGSFFVLGELIIDAELEPFSSETTKRVGCGNCTRCLTICPTCALKPYRLEAHRCLSYQTIESTRGDSPLSHSNRLFGCDLCQRCCPWNRFARSHNESDFTPRSFLSFDVGDWSLLDERSFDDQTVGSALRRMGLEGLKRNLEKL